MKIKKSILFFVISILLILFIAMVLSLFASSYPDGLEKVAEEYGFSNKSIGIIPERFFLIPEYIFGNVGNEYLKTSLAGFFGILIIAAIFFTIYLLSRVKNRDQIKKDRKTAKGE